MRMKILQRVILKDASSVAGGRHNERVIRVLIADDQELVRTGFRVILEAEGDIQVVAEADNGKEAVRQAALTKPEVALMDIRMPELDGLAATEQILRQQNPPTIVVSRRSTRTNTSIVHSAPARQASSSRTRLPHA